MPDEKRREVDPERRARAEQYSGELRDRFLELGRRWMRLRQRFLIALGIQPPDNKTR